MSEFVVPITVEMLTPLEEPERDTCPDCNLPSLLRWHVVFEVATDFLIRAVTLCVDCGREDWQ